MLGNGRDTYKFRVIHPDEFGYQYSELQIFDVIIDLTFQTTLDSEYTEVDNNNQKQRCDNPSMYTIHGCHFEGVSSSEDCQTKCTSHAKSDGQFTSGDNKGSPCTWKECAYTVYYTKEKKCHLADKDCQIAVSSSLKIQLSKRVGKLFIFKHYLHL